MLSVSIKKRLAGFLLDVEFETGGEVMGLLGASGSGKSMTLKCIAGIERPDSGRIVLNGRVLFDSKKKINLSPQERRVGYLFQQFALFPNMTVEQNIASGCRKNSSAVKKAAVAAKLEAMQLTGLENKRPHQLSGGQQQRTALARILINEPELLLLDEPFTALDSYLKWQLELEVADTLREFGRGAILVSHSRDEIYRLCESVCVLDSGRSEEKQSVARLFDTPGTLAALLLSGCKNYSRVAVSNNGSITAQDWNAALKIADPLPEAGYVGIRAHHIRVLAQPGVANTIPCTVTRVIDDVFSTIVMLSPEGGLSQLRVEGDKNSLSRISAGSKVYAHLPEGELMLVCE